jgi:hypothetical protein
MFYALHIFYRYNAIQGYCKSYTINSQFLWFFALFCFDFFALLWFFALLCFALGGFFVFGVLFFGFFWAFVFLIFILGFFVLFCFLFVLLLVLVCLFSFHLLINVDEQGSSRCVEWKITRG